MEIQRFSHQKELEFCADCKKGQTFFLFLASTSRFVENSLTTNVAIRNDSESSVKGHQFML